MIAEEKEFCIQEVDAIQGPALETTGTEVVVEPAQQSEEKYELPNADIHYLQRLRLPPTSSKSRGQKDHSSMVVQNLNIIYHSSHCKEHIAAKCTIKLYHIDHMIETCDSGTMKSRSYRIPITKTPMRIWR